MRAVWPEGDPAATEQAMRNLLGRFGLAGDVVFQQVDKLSGGERSRAALARIVAQGVNVLILDEPTNHLDLWACDALEQALLDFDGTVIVVSHDRFLLNRVVDLLIVLEGDGTAQVIHGNYDTYERLGRARGAVAAVEAPKGESQERRPALPVQAKRKRRFPYRKVEDLENDIAATETRLREFEKLLASTELYRDGDKVKATMQGFEDVKTQLKQLYEQWEEAVELN